jgi:hypothetical protein
VTPREGERALDPRDVELLTALADQAAPAIAALRLTEDLQRSREALVAAREEERRRLRRELHDGVGAALAGIRLQLDAAGAGRRPRARRILDAAVAGVSEAVGDVRGSPTTCGPRARPARARRRPARPRRPAEHTGTRHHRRGVRAAGAAGRHRGGLLPDRGRGGRQRGPPQRGDARHGCGSPSDRTRSSSTSRTTATACAGRRRAAAASGLPSMRQRAEELGGSWRLETLAGRDDVRVELPR